MSDYEQILMFVYSMEPNGWERGVRTCVSVRVRPNCILLFYVPELILNTSSNRHPKIM